MHHMRVLRPAGGIFAFYDGRVEGYRFAEPEGSTATWPTSSDSGT